MDTSSRSSDENGSVGTRSQRKWSQSSAQVRSTAPKVSTRNDAWEYRTPGVTSIQQLERPRGSPMRSSPGVRRAVYALAFCDAHCFRDCCEVNAYRTIVVTHSRNRRKFSSRDPEIAGAATRGP